MNKAWQSFRLIMMGLMTMAILFGAYVVYHHIIALGLLIMSVGLAGFGFYTFRLGACWNGETEKISTQSQGGKLEDKK